MRRVAAREPGAFEHLIGLYQPRLRRLAFRLTGWQSEIDDLIQEVFLAAFEKAGQFRGHASLWTWLTVITLNKSRTATRRRVLRERITTALPWFKPHPKHLNADIDSGESAAQVRSAVASLRPQDRELIVLHYLEGNTPAEIARFLAISPNTVEVRLHRARKRLREVLHDYMKE